MAFATVQIVPQTVVTIGDDGKNRSSHLFDKSYETRWSYKGRYAYNVITLETAIELDSLVFHWYMKKKERRLYRFGVYLSDKDITFTSSDFEAVKQQVQNMYNEQKTIKGDNGDGNETSVMQFGGQVVKSFMIVYTYSSSKKSWFSVKEIEIMGRIAVTGVQCPDGTRYDPVSNDCKPIIEEDDEYHFDVNNVLLFEEDVDGYISETHTFTRNFRDDGSMRLDVNPQDMGGKWRPDTEMVVFLKVSGKNDKEEVSAKTVGGPHNDENPDWGRCYDIGVSFDAKRVRLRQELRHPTPYIERDSVDISGLNLPDMRGIWYGLLFRNRRILRKSDNALLGRMLDVKVNPNPFDLNRNVLNANWIDITSFLDKGKWEDLDGHNIPILEKPFNPERYVDTIRVDGQNSSTFGYRFFRHAQVTPIMVDDEAEMDEIFREARSDTDDDDNEKVTEIVDTMKKQHKVFIAPHYPAPLGETPYFKASDQTTLAEFASGSIKGDYKNIEATAIVTFKRNVKDTANLTISARGYYHAGITASGQSADAVGDAIVGRSPNFSNFMIDVPKFKGKKIGFKWCLRTVDQFDPATETSTKIVVSEAFLNLEPDNAEFEYTPWWRAVYYGKEGVEGLVNKPTDVFVTWASLNDFTIHEFEVREIEPIPEPRRL